MIFDRLCAAVERVDALAKMRPILHQARLFEFPGIAHQTLPTKDDFEAEHVEFLWEHFFLPFRVVALEDPGSCVVVWGGVNQRGLASKWYWIECMPCWQDSSAFCDDGSVDVGRLRRQIPRDPMRQKYDVIISMGWLQGWELLDPDSFGATFTGDLSLHVGVNAKTGRLLFPINALLGSARSRVDRERLVAAGIRNARVALEEVMYFNTPHRFVVECEPAFGVRTRTGQIPRSDARKVYRLQTVTEIRSKLALPHASGSVSGGDGKRAPHEKRAHLRRYPDDQVRWPNAHGKVVMIPASWVGPSEARVGKHMYRIRLDL